MRRFKSKDGKRVVTLTGSATDRKRAELLRRGGYKDITNGKVGAELDRMPDVEQKQPEQQREPEKPKTWDDLTVPNLRALLKAANVQYSDANKEGLVALATQHLGEAPTDEHLAALSGSE